MSTVTETVLIEGLTLANVIWRKYRRQPDGFIGKVLDLNPGLSASIEIPVGAVIIFPIEEIAMPRSTENATRLWD